MALPKPYPDGHFYSPIPDGTELARDGARIWPERAPEITDIDFDPAGHAALLDAFLPLATEYDYGPLATRRECSFVDPNGFFEGLDSRVLFCMLRHLAPKRMVEVGCGWSTALSGDVSARFLGGSMRITCIDPYPGAAARNAACVDQIRTARVQDVPADQIAALVGTGDVLFVDSSHVSRIGSDVNHLVFEVLPQLPSGAVVHFHDMFLPRDYPRQWAEEGRAWNEQYLVRAMLMDSTAWRVLFSCAYAREAMRERTDALGAPGHAGGSLWLRRL